MKRLFLLVLVLVLVLEAAATTVIFPLQAITGNKHNRTILIQPDISTNQLINGTNLVGLIPLVVTPTNGVGRTALLPWSYTVRVDGWPKSFHILVPDSTNVLNAVDLITNAVAIGSAANNWLQSVATSNSATVMWSGNGTSTNPLIATASGGGSTSGFTGTITNLADMNITFSTNYSVIVSSAGTGINGTYTWNGSTLWNGYPWYYLAGGTYGYSLRVDSVSGGYAWRIANAGGPGYIYYQQDGTATPLVTNAFTTLVNGTAPLPVATISNSIITNTGHFNLITFTNGICVTNIVQ